MAKTGPNKKECKKKPCSPCQKDGCKRTSQNGKGDSPRNISEKFRSNYEQINWVKKLD